MILTDSSAANVGATAVTAIASATPSTLQFMCYALTQVQSLQLGLLNLEKNGTETLRLSGTSVTFSGTIKINNGAFEIGNSSALNGIISGNGSVIKLSGLPNPTINGNNTYSGGTSINGIINIGNNNAFGTGAVTATGSSAQIIAASSLTLPNNFQINSGATMQYRVNGGLITLIVSGDISGDGSLNKTSTGRLYLDGTLTYTGSTNITAGLFRARKTEGASTATATFSNTTLSVAFNVSPPSGATTNFRFFQGTTVQTYAAVTLSGLPVGSTAIYTSANSTLSVTVP
jgi:autotransporter-associated beta strand protein